MGIDIQQANLEIKNTPRNDLDQNNLREDIKSNKYIRAIMICVSRF